MFFFFAVNSICYNLPPIEYDTFIQQYFWDNHTDRSISAFQNTVLIFNSTQVSDRGEDSENSIQIVYMSPSQRKSFINNAQIPETIPEGATVQRIRIVEKHRRAKMAQYVENGETNRYDIMTFWVPFVVCILTGVTLFGAYVLWSCDKYENDPANSLMFATEGQKLVRGT